MFFRFDSLLANKGAWMWHNQNNPKNRKRVIFSDFTIYFLIIFLQNRFYPDVKFYVLKDSAEKHVSNW